MKEPKMSDTVTIEWNGSLTVDIDKLLAKPHIQQMLSEIRRKVRIVPKGYSGPSMVPKDE